MDFITLLRAAAVGFAWAGTYFSIIALIFPIFPLPLLFDLYKYSRNYSNSKFKKDAWEGIKWYDRSAKAMRVLAIGIWLFVWGLYLYGLSEILGWYMDLKGRDFWTLFAVAAALPSLWFIRKAFKAWYRTYYYGDLKDEWIQKEISDKPITQQLIENKY